MILKEAATEEIINAWTIAYTFLADLLIAKEKAIREELESRQGGYSQPRTMKVTEKRAESKNITSFHLKPTDDLPLPPFTPGQYISLQVNVPGQEIASSRNYSLSGPPGETYFRISIKREEAVDGKPKGIVSNFFHDQVEVGTEIQVGPPCGHFKLTEDLAKTLVFISCGVGTTPLMSMLLHAVNTVPNEIYNIHYTCDPEHHAFKDTVKELEETNENLKSFVFYSNDKERSSMPRRSRVDWDHLGEIIPSSDCEVFYCGPIPFMKEIHRQLRKLDIPDEQTHYECFQPEVPV